MTQSPKNGRAAGKKTDALAAMAEEAARGAASTADEAVEEGPTIEDAHGAYNLDSIMRIPVSIQVVLGSATMPVSNLMKLGRGAVVPLDHRVGEPVDVVVNGRVVARGEVVVVEDDNSRFGVSLTEIVGSQGPGSAF
ncbi:MAG: flagellar motor switch protein FliN [Salinarimonadaceae bacterium]|nr:MAG: flagellar motor switch protein FliN [Salinarimonadaceae bacterium]